METYFPQSAKNFEQLSFAPVNQYSFLRLPQMGLIEKFNDVRRSGRHCLSRRTTCFHLNFGQKQWKRTLRNTQKVVKNSLVHN